jgi:hypothetical protein
MADLSDRSAMDDMSSNTVKIMAIIIFLVIIALNSPLNVIISTPIDHRWIVAVVSSFLVIFIFLILTHALEKKSRIKGWDEGRFFVVTRDRIPLLQKGARYKLLGITEHRQDLYYLLSRNLDKPFLLELGKKDVSQVITAEWNIGEYAIFSTFNQLEPVKKKKEEEKEIIEKK